jgi:hypothetical protein
MLSSTEGKAEFKKPAARQDRSLNFGICFTEKFPFEEGEQ